MKKALFVIVLLASLLIIRNLVVSIYSLWQKQDLIATTHEQLESEKEKNKVLKEQIDRVQSPLFLEEQARNNLFMVREGEQEVLISTKLLSPQGKIKDSLTQSYWQQWVGLFF